MRSRGSISISILFLTALLTGVAMYSYYYCFGVVTLAKGLVKSERMYVDHWHQIIESIATNDTDPTSDSLWCGAAATPIQLCVVEKKIPEEITSLVASKFRKESFPLVQFNGFFESITPCDRPISLDAGGQTALGFKITSSAIRSHTTCVFESGLPTESIALYENVEAAGEWILEKGQDPSVLASLGYIDVSSASTERSWVVIAGGDLHIGLVATPSSIDVHVTLVSATGVVKVDGVEGPVTFQAYGWEGVYLPENARLGEGPNQLETIEILPLGLAYQ